MHDTAATETGKQPLNRRIRAEAIDLLYRQTRRMQPLSLLNSGFLVFLLWGVIPRTILFAWLGLLIALTLTRSVIGTRYFNRPAHHDNDDRWGRYFTYAALINGIIWGSAGVVLYPPDQIAYQAILFFLLTGMAAGAYVSNTSYLPAFYAFFVPTLLPVIFRLAIDGDALHVTIALWGLAFFLAFLFFGKKAAQEQREAITLRLQNQQLLEELMLKNLAAERANVSKTQFLAAASHDLRQPLFALGLYTEMLEDETDTQKTREIAALIKQSFLSLKGLLDSLLDISRLDAGVVKVHKESFPLQEVFDRIQCDYEPLASERGIMLHIVPTSAVVFSDSTLIERILRNLVSNAINYTRQGRVLLGLKRCGDHYQIRVYDTGIGIPQHELENVFLEFHQLANPERDREKGIGLGLAIVKRLLALLGENIKISSKPGQGTAIFVSVQRSSRSIRAPRIEQLPAIRRDATILLIEDDREVSHSMCAFLDTQGYSVLAADSEDEALRLLLREQVEPDLIISDYRLRDERNGVEAAEAVLGYLGKQLPVLIITGDTAPERIREATSHGYQLLHKPLAPEEFKLTIARLLSNDHPR